MILFDPEKERAGIMQRDVDAGMLFQQGKKRVVGLLIAFLENVFEITGWLVGMNNKGKMERGTGFRHDVPIHNTRDGDGSGG
jgi:hypothetical protein